MFLLLPVQVKNRVADHILGGNLNTHGGEDENPNTAHWGDSKKDTGYDTNFNQINLN